MKYSSCSWCSSSSSSSSSSLSSLGQLLHVANILWVLVILVLTTTTTTATTPAAFVPYYCPSSSSPTATATTNTPWSLMPLSSSTRTTTRRRRTTTTTTTLAWLLSRQELQKTTTTTSTTTTTARTTTRLLAATEDESTNSMENDDDDDDDVSSITTTTTTTATTLTKTKYVPREVMLFRSEPIGNSSSVLLHIDRCDNDDEDDNNEPFTYQPGHVVGLEIPLDLFTDEEKATLIHHHSTTTKNGGYVRAPYTIASASAQTVTILLQKVGPKSRALARAPPKTRLRMGGKFHVPIVQGIGPTAQRLILLSTGVGIGPCVGALEQFLYHPTTIGPNLQQLDLVASFRFPTDVLYQDYLEMWAEASDPPGRLQYTPFITSDRQGRLSDSEQWLQHYVLNRNPPATPTPTPTLQPPQQQLVPSQEQQSSSLLELPFSSSSMEPLEQGLPQQQQQQLLQQEQQQQQPQQPPQPPRFCPVTETHYHLIGNGQMVREWQAGLQQAGVPATHITVESYFHHTSPPPASPDAIRRIAKVIAGGRLPRRLR